MNVEFIHTRLSLRSRTIVALFFYALAALLQLLLVRGGNLPLGIFRFAGLGLLLIPLWFLKIRSFSNKPVLSGRAAKGNAASSSPGIWKTVTMTELDRLRDRIESTRKAKVSGIYGRPFGIALTFLFFFLLFPAGVVAGAAGVFVLLDLYLIFFPFLWFAGIEKWYPAISGKIVVFEPVLEAKLPGKLRISPMLFFDGGGGIPGEPVPAESPPTDMRLMLAPGADAPQEVRDELLGAQFQLSYNNGPNGAVPYMYAVFITRGKGRIWQSLKNVRAACYVTETGSSAEGSTVYGTVVVRLDTKSRPDGYYTNESDVRELLDLVVSALEKLC